MTIPLKAMSTLMTDLQETQMWAVYQMGMGNEMPISVTKEDLTCIIAFLFKQLDWIDEESPSHTSVESPILVDSLNSASQAQKMSLHWLTSEPNRNDEDRTSEGDGVKHSSVEVAEHSAQVDQNDKQNQSNSQVENIDLLVGSEKYSRDEILEVMENSLEDSSKLKFV